MLRSRFPRSYDPRVPVTGAPLLERERELEEFERLRAAARRGEGAAAVVEGPAGIGKTRLLAAAGEGAEGLEVLRARASELERDFPFGVVRQLFAWVGRERCSIGEVCRRLQAQQIPSPKGKPYGDRTTVWGILKNPPYKGRAQFG